MYHYLLTLLLLFIAPHESALAPVMSADGGIDCSDDYHWEGDLTYYTWEACLFDYSGTHDDDMHMSPEDHWTLYRQVWSDYMGAAPAPALRFGPVVVEQVCGLITTGPHAGEPSGGCFDARYEPCGPWLTCLVPQTVAVADTGRRALLHETAHAIYYSSRWHPYWGSGSWGATLATDSHTIGYRCLLLDIYRTYTGQVADDAYQMLHAVCAANGWAHSRNPSSG